MITFMEFLQGMDTNGIVSNFLSSDVSKRVAHMDCKTVTRAFITWAGQNGIKARVILLVPPSPEMIKKHPEMGGKGGQGDAHIMPVVNNDAIDFTARHNIYHHRRFLWTPIGLKNRHGGWHYCLGIV